MQNILSKFLDIKLAKKVLKTMSLTCEFFVIVLVVVNIIQSYPTILSLLNNKSSAALAGYTQGGSSKALPSFSMAADTFKTKAVTKKSIITPNSDYALGITIPIYGLAINADINLNNTDSLVRIILIDKSKNEYLVYEAFSSLNGKNSFSVNNICEETCALNGIIPDHLKIQINNAQLNISSVNYSSALNSQAKATGVKVFNNNLKTSQVDYKITQINQQIKNKNRKWVAGITSVSNLSYAEKKQLFSNLDGTPLKDLPNLQGFEYYKGGIFQIQKTDVECSYNIRDGICPPNNYCDLSLDIDCCEQSGNTWDFNTNICNHPCSMVDDHIAPKYCTADNDYNVCVNSGGDVVDGKCRKCDSVGDNYCPTNTVCGLRDIDCCKVTQGEFLNDKCNFKYPETYDWRNVSGENWVSPVKNQGLCGSCWLFSAAASIESYINVKYNKHLNVDMSEQFVGSCYSIGGMTGGDMCYGGQPSWANPALKDGWISEECLPYQAKDSIPCENKCSNPFFTIKSSGLIRINPATEETFKGVVFKNGPIPFVIDAWAHAVLLVGYSKIKAGDVLNNYTTVIIQPGDPLIGQTAWVFKNSWGSSWGENGFGKIALPENMLSSQAFVLKDVDVGHSGPSILSVGCTDKDNDKYCSWGISEQPPAGTVCPTTCKKDGVGKLIKDCDDSNSAKGSFISQNNLNCKLLVPVLAAPTSTLQATPGGWAKLRGTNLTTNVTLVNTTYPVLSLALSDSNQRLDFKIDPRETPGTYQIYVTNDAGQSNYLTFTVLPKTTVTCTSFTYSNWSTCVNSSQTRAISTSSPAGCTGGTPALTQSCILKPKLVESASLLQATPGGWAKLRGTNLTTNVTLVNTTYPVLSLALSDSNQRLDFKIDPRETPGTYQIYVTNDAGHSNYLTFTVLPKLIDCSVTPNSIKDYYTKTRVAGIVSCADQSSCMTPSTVPDSCANGTVLNKYYCSNGYRYVDIYTCKNGCNDGACIKLSSSVNSSNWFASVLNPILKFFK